VKGDHLEVAAVAGFGVLGKDLVAEFDFFDRRQAGFGMDQRPGGEKVDGAVRAEAFVIPNTSKGKW
jgi:hypothetical protein